MRKVVSKLVECGFSFEYENRNSNGERIVCYEISLIINNYQGKLYFEHEGDSETYDEKDSVYNHFCAKIEQIMIDKTSSF